MRILLLSAYDTLSHRYWRESLVKQFPQYQWTVLHLAPRYFNYRVRSNPLSWSSQHRKILEQPYELVIATSLVDTSTLRGLVPSLAQTPLWVYCHENQFAYPSSLIQDSRRTLQHDLEVKMVFLYNCLCADWISFNSNWNRNTALQELSELLKAFPEKTDPQCMDSLEIKSDVLPVPLNEKMNNQLPAGNPKKLEAGREIQVVWNHRWEYDKGPDFLLAFVKELSSRQIPVCLHVTGKQFRQQPEAFDVLQRYLETENSSVRKGVFGFLDSRNEYMECLESSDIVLSTALHDFQGLSILEAVQCGCIPLLPDKLAYPEFFEEKFLYEWKDLPEDCARSAVDKLVCLQKKGDLQLPDLVRFDWSCLREAYACRIESLVSAIPSECTNERISQTKKTGFCKPVV